MREISKELYEKQQCVASEMLDEQAGIKHDPLIEALARGLSTTQIHNLRVELQRVLNQREQEQLALLGHNSVTFWQCGYPIRPKTCL